MSEKEALDRICKQPGLHLGREVQVRFEKRRIGFLEFHHVVPFARGGLATVANIALRCRAHNQYEGKLEFGRFDPPIVRESSAHWGVIPRGS